MVEHAHTETVNEYRFDPSNPADMLGLDDSIVRNRRTMQPFVDQYREFLEQFVGFHYSDQGSEKHLPINYVEMLVTILGRRLVAEHPRVMVTTDKPKLRQAAYEMTLAGDKRIKELNVKKAIQDTVKAAFFGLGIAKVGTEIDGQVQIHGEPRDVVHPWVDWIDLDDIVLDMSAKSIRDTTFVAQRFTIPLAIARTNEAYDGVDKSGALIREKLKPDEPTDRNDDGSERTQSLGAGEEAHHEPFMPLVDLWEAWLPLYRLVVTYSRQHPGIPLRVVEWTGPENGPFHFLAFEDVPGNIMPLSPIASVKDLHDQINMIYRKLFEQARNQKKVLLVRDDQVGQQIQSANDLGIVNLKSPKNDFAEVNFNGPDQPLMGLGLHLDPLADRASGMLSIIGGLDSNAETLGQEQIQAAGAGGKISAWQDKVYAFTKGIAKDLILYDTQNELLQIPVTMTVARNGMEYPSVVTPAKHAESFRDMNFDIVPYSMQDKTPESKASMLTQIVNLLAPLGVMPNVGELVDLFGQYTGMASELKRVYPQGSKPSDQPQQDRPQKSPATAGITGRRSSTGGSQQGRNADLAQQLMATQRQTSGAT